MKPREDFLEQSKMEIAVVGCGWSGSLLADTLSKEHKVTVYERSRKLKVICACGIPTTRLHEIAEQHGLEAEKYILWKSKTLTTEYRGKQRRVSMKGLCTFDKHQFMKDLNVDVQFSSHIGPKSSLHADLVVDATGTRGLLGHLPKDVICVTYQVRAQFKEFPFDDFYMRFPSDMNKTIYLWFFPIAKKQAYVGCGSLQGGIAAEEVNRFLHEHGGEILEKQAKQLRINPPVQSLPFYRGNVVGIGGSVGAISSFGDGNDPSAVTADLLARNIINLSEYQRQVFRQLKWLEREYAYYKSLAQNRKLSLLINLVMRHPNLRKRYQTPINPFAYTGK